MTEFPSLVVYTVDSELRVRDEDVGILLAFSRPRDVRKLIDNHRDKLLTMGTLPVFQEATTGRPSETTYLNRDQALYVTLKSETEKAFEVQMEIIRCYSQYLDGKLQMSSTSEIDLISSHLEALQDREREVLASLRSIRDEMQVDLDKLNAIKTQAQTAMEKVQMPSPPVLVPYTGSQPRIAGPEPANLPPMPGLSLKPN